MYGATTGIEKLLLIHEIGFEEAALPTASEERKKQLLNFAVVGGGRKSLLCQSVNH